MVRLRFLVCLFASACCLSAQAAITFDIESYDSLGNPEMNFDLGDMITIRVLAVDSDAGGADLPPVFTTDNITAFNVNLIASTTDADEAAGTETINAEFELGQNISPAPLAFSDLAVGRSYSGLSFDGNTILSGLALVEFTYTADVAGPTVFSAGPGNNNASFQLGGTGVPFLFDEDAMDNSPLKLMMPDHRITVAAVPEPSSCAVLALGTFALGLRCRRRRRDAKSA